MYNGYGPRNDLAIVITKDEIEFNARVNKVTLPVKSYFDLLGTSADKLTELTGWGYFDITHKASNELRQAELMVLDESFCIKIFKNEKIQERLLERNIFCAASYDAWSCGGDSGSPRVQGKTLVGILHGSKRKYCNFTLERTPSLFANVIQDENMAFILKWMRVVDQLD